MAPPPRHPSPLAQLADLAREAKAAGLPFPTMWDRAVRPGQATVLATTENPPAGAIRWPTDLYSRRAWHTALTGSREAWRRAYEDQPPTAAEAAVTGLADALALPAGRPLAA